MTTSPGLLVVSINHPPTLAMIQVKRFHGPTDPDQAPPVQAGEGDERKETTTGSGREERKMPGSMQRKGDNLRPACLLACLPARNHPSALVSVLVGSQGIGGGVGGGLMDWWAVADDKRVTGRFSRVRYCRFVHTGAWMDGMVGKPAPVQK
jgi:hypothetical protein